METPQTRKSRSLRDPKEPLGLTPAQRLQSDVAERVTKRAVAEALAMVPPTVRTQVNAVRQGRVIT